MASGKNDVRYAARVATPKQATAKRHTKRWIALGIIIVVIIALYVVYVQYGSLPSAIISAELSGQQLNSSTLQGIIFQKVNTMPEATANYSGTIIINHDPPFQFSFSKYGNSTRVSLTVNNLTGFGTVEILYIGHGPIGSTLNGTACLNAYNDRESGGFQDSAIMDELRSTGTYTDGYYCLNTQGNSSIIDGFINSFINLTSLTNMSIKNYGINVFKDCYTVSGSGNIEVNSTLVGIVGNNPQTPATLNFSTCLSGQNNLPINVTVNLIVHDTGIPYQVVPRNPLIPTVQLVNQTLLSGTAFISGPSAYNEYFCSGTGGGGDVNWTADAQAYNSTWLQPQPKVHPITPSPDTAPGGFGNPELNYYPDNFASVGHKNGSVCSTSLYQANASLNTLGPSEQTYGINRVTYGEACVSPSEFYTYCVNMSQARYYPTCLDYQGCNNTSPLYGNKAKSSNLYVITCNGSAGLTGCNTTNQVLHLIQPNQSYDWYKQTVVTTNGYSDIIYIAPYNNTPISTAVNYSALYTEITSYPSYPYPGYDAPGLAAIGLLNPPPYTIVGKIEVANDTAPAGPAPSYSNTYYLNYTIPQGHSFSLISLACARSNCVVTAPSGCTIATGAYGNFQYSYSNMMYTCTQNAGTYSMAIKTNSTIRYIAGAVYDFGPTGNTTVNIAMNQSAFVQASDVNRVTALP